MQDARRCSMTPAEIARGLIPMEREWLTGWQGVAGAAFNAIGARLARLGLTRSYTDWNLSPLGLEVCAILEQEARDGQ